MAARRTNLALLALLAGSLGTGVAAFAVGTVPVRWIVVAHGAMGLGLLLLVPWKWPIVRRGARRRGARRAAPAVLFGILVGVSLAAGAAHSTGLWRAIGPLTAMQIHVGSALVAVPFGVWHVVARPVRVRRTDLSRRTLLRAGGVAAGSLALYGIGAAAIELAGEPGSRRRSTGSFPPGSRASNDLPVTQWLFDRVPSIDPLPWRLVVVGRHGTRGWTLDELDAMSEPLNATLDCTGGWYSTQTWEGVRLDSLVDPGDWSTVVVASETGYRRKFPAGDVSHLWLATGVGGAPLEAGHGFPARLVAPGRRGFWWVKWVTRIEAIDDPWWWQPPFPLG